MLGKRSRKMSTRPRKTTRRVRRRMVGPTRVRSLYSKSSVMSCKRTFWLANWQPSTTTTNDFWKFYSFTWAQLPSLAEFQSLFDTGRINGIKVTFRPKYDNFAGSNTTDTTLPGVTNQGGVYAHVIVDPTSVTTPSGTYTSSNLNTFLEQGNVKTYQGIRPFSVYFQPKMNYTVGAVQGMRQRAPYLLIDAATGATSAPHYGFHIFMQDQNLTGVFGQSWDVFVTYYMSFRGVK